jgi:uncharacterized protein (TIGR03083 family)
LEPRDWFAVAADGFREVLAGIEPDQLGDPGLGDWDVRALLGHTSRAFLTVETYLSAEPKDEPVLAGPADYFRAAAAGLADPAQVDQRGRDAGQALGADALAAAAEIADRVTTLVDASSDDAPVSTPVGRMRLVDYLPARAFELTVHGIDLARATGQAVPRPLTEAAPEAIRLAAQIAEADQRLEILLALTGRGRLPEGYSVL